MLLVVYFEYATVFFFKKRNWQDMRGEPLNHTISELKQCSASKETSEFQCNPSFFRTTSAINLPKQHHMGRTDFELLDLSRSGRTWTGPSRREVGPITISSIWKSRQPNVKSDQSTMKFNVDVDITCVCKLC